MRRRRVPGGAGVSPTNGGRRARLCRGRRPVLALLLLALSRPALADDSAKEKATRLVREGAGLYSRGEHEAAVARFEEAYATFPSPAILFNLGKAYRGVGKNAAAHRAFSRFLRDDDRTKPARRKEATTALTDLESKVGLVSVTVTIAGSVVSIDGKEVGQAPLREPIAVEPGAHEITANSGDSRARRQIDVAAGSRVSVGLQPAESSDVDGQSRVPPPHEAVTPDEPAASVQIPVENGAPDRPLYKKWWFWGGVGAVVVVAATVIIVNSGGDDVIPIEGTLGTVEF